MTTYITRIIHNTQYCRKLPFNNSAVYFSTTANVASPNSALCTAYRNSVVVMIPAIHADYPSTSLGGDSFLYCKYMATLEIRNLIFVRRFFVSPCGAVIVVNVD